MKRFSMKEFLFYTCEGFTYSPNDDEVENMKILGFEKADTYDEAYDLLLKNNDWIIETGFNKEKILCVECIR